MNPGELTVRFGQGLGPFALGSSRAEILRIAAAADIPVITEEDEPRYAEVADADVVFRFEETGENTLWQIDLAEPPLTVAGESLLGKRPHEVAAILNIQSGDATLWRRGYDAERPTLTASVGNTGHVDTKDQTAPHSIIPLFQEGTLWSERHGLGIAFHSGTAEALLLRQLKDFPRHGEGPWTPAHDEFSRTFQEQDLPGATTISAQRWSRRARILVTLVCGGMGVWLGREAWQYQQRWDAAPTVQGVVLSVEPPPPEPFPERFHVGYRATDGTEHEVEWTLADIYVPRAVGETVEVRYLSEHPDRPLGPARIRDAAFLKYGPDFIVLGLAFLVLLGVGELACWVLRCTISAVDHEPSAG